MQLHFIYFTTVYNSVNLWFLSKIFAAKKNASKINYYGEIGTGTDKAVGLILFQKSFRKKMNRGIFKYLRVIM